MANETTSTTITETIPVIVTAAMVAAVQTEVMLPLVFVDTSLLNGPGLVAQLPLFATATAAADGSENTDYTTLQALDTTPGPSNITCAEILKRIDVTDLAVLGSRENLVAVAGQILGQGIGLKRDGDLSALITGFSQTVAGAGTTLTEAHLVAARNYLEKAFAPKPYNCVLHPDQIWSAKGIWAIIKGAGTGGGFMTTGSGTVGEEMNLMGWVTQALGMVFYSDATIDNNVGAGGDAAGGVFSREAIEYVPKRGFQVESQRDASLRNTELIASVIKGDGERRDTFGVYALSDVS